MKRLLRCLPILLVMLTTAHAKEDNSVVLDDYRGGISKAWKVKKFNGLTSYNAGHDDQRSWIKAVSRGTASGLFYKIKYSPEKLPFLSWSWKIGNIIKSGDAHLKSGDDYTARIYVVFPNLFFWRTKALNYVWANKLPQGEMVANPYTANAVMIAVESGPKRAGEWVVEQRNVYQDFIQAFGYAPPKVGAIAIMTDSDDTAEEATAWYGSITLQATP